MHKWHLLEIGYNYYFQYECQNGVERDRIQRTLNAIRSMDDPREYDGVAAMCPIYNRLLVNVIDSEFKIAMIVRDKDDPEEECRNCLELVTLIEPHQV